jgi:hypothetical protein
MDRAKKGGSSIRRLVPRLEVTGAFLLMWLAIAVYRALHLPSTIRAIPGVEVHYYITPETELHGDILDQSGGFEVSDKQILVPLFENIIELRKSDQSVTEAGLLLARWKGGPDTRYAHIATDGSGLLLIQREDALFQFGPEGPDKVADLPSGMTVFSSKEAGLSYALLGNSVFLLSGEEGTVQEILELPPKTVPQLLCEGSDGYYIVVINLPSDILSAGTSAHLSSRWPGRFSQSSSQGITGATQIYEILGQQKRLVYTAPVIAPSSDATAEGALFDKADGSYALVYSQIEDMACTDRSDLLFYSTTSNIYALIGTTAIPITSNLGGKIRWRDGVLYAYDAKGKFVVGLSGLANALGIREALKGPGSKYIPMLPGQ